MRGIVTQVFNIYINPYNYLFAEQRSGTRALKQKRFSCRSCDKTYAHRSSLSIHMRSHTGKKPHRCPYCQKAFSQSGNMKTHVRTHTNERPYDCEFCQKSFKQMSALRSHEYLHIRGYLG